MGLDGPDPLMGLCPSRSAMALGAHLIQPGDRRSVPQRMQPDMLHARRLGCDLNNPMEDSSKDPVKQRRHSLGGGLTTRPRRGRGRSMARRIAAQPAEVSGIRGALIVDLEAALNRLIGADSEIYDFSGERDWLAEKLRICVPGAMCTCWVGGCRANIGPQRRSCFACAATRCTRPTTSFPLTPTTRAEYPILCRGQST